MYTLRKALRKAFPLAFGCVLTVGLVYVLFGKTEAVTTPTFSGASAVSAVSAATVSAAAVSATAVSATAAAALDSDLTTATTVLVASEAPPVPVPATSPTSTSPAVVAVPVTIAVIGDTYTAESAIGGTGARNWTSIVGTTLERAGYTVRFDVDATPGSGYVKTGVSGPTFIDEINRTVNADTSIVVLFGSRYDDGIIPREQVGSTARIALARIRTVAPKAKIVMIGPAWVDKNFPGYIAGIEWELKAAAQRDNATFLDPIADQWFFGATSTMIGSDGVSPTDAGHTYMAGKILPVLTTLLPPLR